MDTRETLTCRAAQHNNSLQYLVFGQLDFNLVWLIGDLQLRVQSFLSFFQPVCQLPPGLMELEGTRAGVIRRSVFEKPFAMCKLPGSKINQCVLYVDYDSNFKLKSM